MPMGLRVTAAGTGTAGGGRMLVVVDVLGTQTVEKKKMCVVACVRALVVSGASSVAILVLGPSARALWFASARKLG